MIACPDYEVFQFAEKDAAVIDTIAAAQQQEEELLGEMPFLNVVLDFSPVWFEIDDGLKSWTTFAQPRVSFTGVP